MSRRSPEGRSLPAPGAGSRGGTRLPAVDDRLAPPETRLEYFGGGEMYAAPADMGHATLHFDLAYVLGAHVARGYIGAVDLLTRTDEATDFAPDASVFALKPGGGRKLEELAFEVTDKQAIKVPTIKARELVRRGVRRVFAILVKHRRVLEWSRATDGWQSMPMAAAIEDHCFVRPLPLAALLDATDGDEAVVRALLARGVPALEAALDAKREQGREQGREEGRDEGREVGHEEGLEAGEREGELRMSREAIVAVLEARGVAIPSDVRAEIAASANRAELRRWLVRAATTDSARDILLPRRKR